MSRVWIFKLHKQGLLRGYLIGRKQGQERGGQLMFREDDIMEFLRAQGVPVDEAQRGGAGQGGP